MTKQYSIYKTLIFDFIVHPVGPVRAIEVGPGMCRGKGWTFDNWPIGKGLQVERHPLIEHICIVFNLSFFDSKKQLHRYYKPILNHYCEL
jgi:hypothetical protein